MRRRSQTTLAIPWDEPTRHSMPVPDPDMFAGLMGEIAEEASGRTEADKVGIYVSLLAITGMLAGRKPHVMIGDRRHPLLVWPLLMGRTGSGRKGDAIASATLAAGSAFLELDSLTVTGLGSGEGLVWHIRDPDEKGGTEDKRLLVIEEELGHIIALSAREGSTLSSIIRKAWDGGRLQSLTRHPYIASWSHVSIIAGITPAEFRMRVSNRDLASGLWNRYMPLFVERRELIASPDSMDGDVLERFSNGIEKAVNTAASINAISLSGQARSLLEDELYPEFADLAEEEDKVADFLERGTAYLRRVAALTAALDGRKQVRAEDLSSSAWLIRYSLASARYALDTGKRNPRLDRLQRAADEASPELLGRRWIYETLFHHNVSSEDIQEIIDTLCNDERYRDNKGRPLYEERSTPRTGGGRPRRQFGRVRSLSPTRFTRFTRFGIYLGKRRELTEYPTRFVPGIAAGRTQTE